MFNFVIVTLRNVGDIVKFAVAFSADQLKRSCLQFICVNAASLLEGRYVHWVDKIVALKILASFLCPCEGKKKSLVHTVHSCVKHPWLLRTTYLTPQKLWLTFISPAERPYCWVTFSLWDGIANMRVYICLFVCLRPYTVNFKLTHYQALNVKPPHVLSWWRLQPECSIGDLKWRRQSWSTHGNLHVVRTATDLQQQAQCNIWTVVGVASRKQHSYTPETQLMIWVWSLVSTRMCS